MKIKIYPMDKDLRQDFNMQGVIQIEKQVVLNSRKQHFL